MNVDPITLEVMRNSLASLAEEMVATLVRTALSPNLKECRDCSAGVYTCNGDLVAQASHIPLHLGIMPYVVRTAMEILPLSELSQGDAIIINDPYLNGSHLPDICIITPVFYGGQPLAVVANLAHHVDVGGAAPGSMSTTATEIFQEGIRIPPLKICRRRKINSDLISLIQHNVRTPAEFKGNLQAQINANLLGEKRLLSLAARYGPDLLKRYMKLLLDYTERRLRSSLNTIPKGTYYGEDFLEGDGLGLSDLPIRVTIKAQGDSMQVDFSGTAPQAAGPVNATRAVTMACVYYIVKSVTDPDIPSNEGLSRPFTVITPPGSLVNPIFPAPVAHASINTAQRIADVLLKAMAQAVPNLVTAAGAGSMNCLTIGGIHPATGQFYAHVETCGGGQGAKYNQDGMDGVHVHLTNTLNTPVEVLEQNYPLRVEQYALRPGSGGPGTFRGGLGLVREITILGHWATVAVSTERVCHSPWGLAGGGPGANARCTITTPDQTVSVIGTDHGGKFTCRVPPGTVITLQTAGGGGFGDHRTRDVRAIEQDLKEGLVRSDGTE